jgi:formyltetrahydrofolate synthetase
MRRDNSAHCFAVLARATGSLAARNSAGEGTGGTYSKKLPGEISTLFLNGQFLAITRASHVCDACALYTKDGHATH